MFEPNRESTLLAFNMAVEPVLQNIQSLSGLESYSIKIDTSTTTPEDVVNNTIRGKIYVQPKKTLEFVSLDFIISNNLQQNA